MPSAQFENEAMNCGERKVSKGRTDRFALIGVDLYQALARRPRARQRPGHRRRRAGRRRRHRPDRPRTSARGVKATTSTHTVTCIDETDCRYAYSAGDSGRHSSRSSTCATSTTRVRWTATRRRRGVRAPASVAGGGPQVELRRGRLRHPHRLRRLVVFDVRDPRHPRLLTATTGDAGGARTRSRATTTSSTTTPSGPTPRRFRPNAAPSLANGNVLLVTEEDYEETDCATAGSFQTWHVKRLDGSDGSIVPLDKVELADLGTYPVPAGRLLLRALVRLPPQRHRRDRASTAAAPS